MSMGNENSMDDTNLDDAGDQALSVAKNRESDGVIYASTHGIISRDALMFNESPESSLGEEAFGKRVLLDLSDCERIDSAGVSWLIRFHQRCQAAGGKLIFHSIPPMVEKTLKLLNMGMVFSVADNVQAALQMAGEE